MCAASMIVRAQEKKIELPTNNGRRRMFSTSCRPKSGLHGSDCAPFGARALHCSPWQRRDPAPKPARMSSRKSTTAVCRHARFGDARAGWATPRGSVYIGMDRPMRSSHPSSYREVWLYRDGRQFEFSGEDYRIKLQKPDPGSTFRGPRDGENQHRETAGTAAQLFATSINPVCGSADVERTNGSDPRSGSAVRVP